VLLAGIRVTIALSILAMLLAAVMGLVACFGTLAKSRLIRARGGLLCRVLPQHADSCAARLGPLRVARDLRRQVRCVHQLADRAGAANRPAISPKSIALASSRSTVASSKRRSRWE